MNHPLKRDAIGPHPLLTGVLALLSACVLGCDAAKNGLVQVTGVVSCGGSPVAKGNVNFLPKGGGRPSIGEIQADGAYSLSTFERNDGVPRGDYRVTIKVVDVLGGIEEGGPPDFRWVVPRRFSSAETSDLTATVEGTGRSQVINFNVPAE